MITVLIVWIQVSVVLTRGQEVIKEPTFSSERDKNYRLLTAFIIL